MGNARAVLAGILPVVPQAGKNAVFVLVITDRTTEMATDVADRLDLAFIFVQENVVIIDPARELAGLLQLVKRSEVSKIGLSTFIRDPDELGSG